MCSRRPVAVLVGSIWDEDFVLDAAAYEDVPDEAADSTERKGAGMFGRSVSWLVLVAHSHMQPACEWF